LNVELPAPTGTPEPVAQDSPKPPSLSGRAASGHALGDNLFLIFTGVAAALINVTLVIVVVILSSSATPSISRFGLSFLWGTSWVPPTGISPQSYGAAPFVFGTLTTSALALLLGVPLSIGIAIFLVELSPRWLREPIGFVVELLAAIPSVVYGLWGIFVLVPLMGSTIDPALQSLFGGTPVFSGSTQGKNMLTAGVILAIMIVPTVAAISRDALQSVPRSQREAALSLGATPWETTRMAVLTYARSGIFGAIILGLGRAIGETMAVLMVIGNGSSIQSSLLSPGSTIASWIGGTFAEAQFLEQRALLELGIVLLGISILTNVLARLLFRGVTGAREETGG
jgi:phosphate transport system permease protein